MAEMKQNNLAFDYSVYDEAVRSGSIDEDNTSETRAAVVKEPSAHRTTSIIKAFFIAVAVMGILFAMIYGRVELTALYSQQSDMEAELTRLRNENVSLESELAQKTGLTKIEDYAENQLGLKKLDRTQIEYVEVPKTAVAKAAETGEDNFFVSIKHWFNSVLEYIGAQ
ncbi:MAG: cell division protein FtsL [Ruminococcus sp.]|nr:cell division protein FtsL [Ruminococcus sp.]